MRSISIVSVSLLLSSVLLSAGLPKNSIQILIKSLQDSNDEVRLAAATAFVGMESDLAVRPLEAALIASHEAPEQDALVKALIKQDDSQTPKRLSDSLINPQFTWGKGAKPRAVEVIAKIQDKKAIKWLTDLSAGEQEPAIRAMAIKMLGELGAEPKKVKS